MIERFDCAPDVVERLLASLPRNEGGGLVGGVEVVTCYCMAPGIVLVRGDDLTAHWPPSYRITSTA